MYLQTINNGLYDFRKSHPNIKISFMLKYYCLIEKSSELRKLKKLYTIFPDTGAKRYKQWSQYSYSVIH